MITPRSTPRAIWSSLLGLALLTSCIGPVCRDADYSQGDRFKITVVEANSANSNCRGLAKRLAVGGSYTVTAGEGRNDDAACNTKSYVGSTMTVPRELAMLSLACTPPEWYGFGLDLEMVCLGKDGDKTVSVTLGILIGSVNSGSSISRGELSASWLIAGSVSECKHDLYTVDIQYLGRAK